MTDIYIRLYWTVKMMTDFAQCCFEYFEYFGIIIIIIRIKKESGKLGSRFWMSASSVVGLIVNICKMLLGHPKLIKNENKTQLRRD